jgi:protein RecA
MARAKKIDKPGRLSIADMRKAINKKAGYKVAHDLTTENPTEVKYWIPTGSRWLDSIVCRGRMAGIPGGKVAEISGLPASGKSYMAAQIAANAQKMGIDVIYFDAESALDPTFLENAGCDLDNLLYIQAANVEFVFETIETVLNSTENKVLFVWDSLALTPTISDIEGDFNPQSSMAVKARVLSKAFQKVTIPLANHGSTILILNQLKTKIHSNPMMAKFDPYTTPGGKAVVYACSLRIWLTARKGKDTKLMDSNNFQIGSEVKVKLKKSRFGTENRECILKIIWGEDDVRICDEEGWLEALQFSKSDRYRGGAWKTLVLNDGTEKKFQEGGWLECLKDDLFRESVFQIMDEEIIRKFDKREGDANSFTNLEPEEE